MGKLVSFSIFFTIFAVVLALLVAYLDSPSENAIELLNKMAAADPLTTREENFRKLSKTALVVGYTGETGSALVKELADRSLYAKVKLVGRRNVEFDDNRKEMEQVIVDYDKLEESHADVFAGVDHVFCCLGTTRGEAGADGFRKVDHDYVVATARLAKKANCSHYHLQSSTGANKDSKFLYPQVKGQVEAEITELGFERTVHYRPGLLTGTNREKRRFVEAAAQVLFSGISKVTNSGSCPITKVARAMVNMAITPSDNKVDILDNNTIHKIADQK